MTAYLVEVQAKLILRSDVDPDDLPANIYSRISEFIVSDDDVIDLDVMAYSLPESEGGAKPHR